MAFADRMVVRRCTCGRLDLRERWLSARTAEYAGAWQRPWTCGFCGRSSFTLVIPHLQQAEDELAAPMLDDMLIVCEEDVGPEGYSDPAMSAELLDEVRPLAHDWRTRLARARVAQVMRRVRTLFHQRREGLARRA